MLHTAPQAPFPYPGSIAEYQGHAGRIFQSLPGGMSIFAPSGGGHQQRVPTALLVDPTNRQLNDEGLSRDHAKTLAWLDQHLRTANQLIFNELKSAAYIAAHRGEACHVDAYALAGLLRRLGWKREPRHPGQSQSLRIWSRGAPDVAL